MKAEKCLYYVFTSDHNILIQIDTELTSILTRLLMLLDLYKNNNDNHPYPSNYSFLLITRLNLKEHPSRRKGVCFDFTKWLQRNFLVFLVIYFIFSHFSFKHESCIKPTINLLFYYYTVSTFKNVISKWNVKYTFAVLQLWKLPDIFFFLVAVVIVNMANSSH